MQYVEGGRACVGGGDLRLPATWDVGGLGGGGGGGGGEEMGAILITMNNIVQSPSQCERKKYLVETRFQ
jgi:hypothetical protein